MNEATIQYLTDHLQITDALARYCRGVDRGDADLVRSVYHPDAPDDHGYTVVESGWALADLCDRDNPNGFPREWLSSTHTLTNILVRLDGDNASSESYFQATMRFRHDDHAYRLISTGRYIDQWERRNDEFRISDRVVVTDETRTERVEAEWPGPDTDVPKAFWGAPALDVPPSVPTGSNTEADPSYRLSPPLQ